MSFDFTSTKLLHTNIFIDNEWAEADGGKTFTVSDPANNKVLATVANGGKAEVERAIASATAALPGWKASTALKRSRILRKWLSLILENQTGLAKILSAEQGKPLPEAVGEIRYGASFIEWFAEEGKRIYGDVVPPQNKDHRITVLKEPIGVVAAITPWNFPVAMITRKVAPALAAGCTVIVKPSEETPLSALALAYLAHQAGLPPGVLNVVPSDQAPLVGRLLCNSPQIKKLSFTGSTKVGRLLMAQCAPTLKKLSLELGGNAPFIVFNDADIKGAVAGAMNSKFRNAGQTCIAANRFLIQSDIQEEFLHEMKSAVATLKVAPATDHKADIGPLINTAAFKKVTELIDAAVANGAIRHDVNQSELPKGNFMKPVILTNVKPDMEICQAELFGPVITIQTFEDEAEAISIANATDAGLAAYFYGRDYARIWRVAEALEYGMVGINTGTISSVAAPFGGIKQSGFGREGSKYGIEEYVTIKYLCWNLGQS